MAMESEAEPEIGPSGSNSFDVGTATERGWVLRGEESSAMTVHPLRHSEPKVRGIDAGPAGSCKAARTGIKQQV